MDEWLDWVVFVAIILAVFWAVLARSTTSDPVADGVKALLSSDYALNITVGQLEYMALERRPLRVCTAHQNKTC